MYQLSLALMRRFRTPVPGVVVSQIRIDGFSGEAVQSCFHRLLQGHILCMSSVADAEGSRFRGQLVGLTVLGAVLLDCAPASHELAVALEKEYSPDVGCN